MSGIFYALNILSINITNVSFRHMLVILSGKGVCEIPSVQCSLLFLVEIKRLPLIYFLLFVISVFHIFRIKNNLLLKDF